MDERTLSGVEQELVAWGILERAPTLRPTRRFRGALMRAAARLRDEEMAGARRPGHPMDLVVEGALEAYPLPPGASAGRAHRMFLVAIQLSSLPEEILRLLDANGEGASS